MQALPKTVISKLLDDKTELCINNPQRLLKALGYLVKCYFGVNVDTVDGEIYGLAIQKINERFPRLTFEQLNLSYSESVIEKKQGVSITVNELIQPVDSFVGKIELLKREAEQIKKEIEEEEESKQKIKESYQEAKQLYFDSMGTGMYQGDMFQASMIMEAFSDLLDIDTKKKMLEQANAQYNNAVLMLEKEENEFGLAVPTGVGMYRNGKPKPKSHYFLSIIVINHFLQKKTFDGMGWKFVEAG